MHKTKLSKFVEWLLYILFAAGVVILVTFPWLFNWYVDKFPDFYGAMTGYDAFIIAFVMVNGVASLWILAELISLVRSVGNDPFIAKNIKSLKRMGIVALCMAGTFAIKCIFFITPLTVACGSALALCGLFSLVLSGVFCQAVLYKQENDLTI